MSIIYLYNNSLLQSYTLNLRTKHSRQSYTMEPGGWTTIQTLDSPEEVEKMVAQLRRAGARAKDEIGIDVVTISYSVGAPHREQMTTDHALAAIAANDVAQASEHAEVISLPDTRLPEMKTLTISRRRVGSTGA